jgi:hypothetical protein
MRPSRWTRRAHVALGALVFLAMGCESPTAPAAVGTADVELPSGLATTQPCTGEAFYFEPSRIHLAYRAEPDAAQGFHVSVHEVRLLAGQDARGTAYQSAHETRNYSLLTREVPRDPQPDQYQIVETEVSDVKLIAKGVAPDFRLHVTYHLIINVNTQTGATDIGTEVVGVDAVCGQLVSASR